MELSEQLKKKSSKFPGTATEKLDDASHEGITQATQCSAKRNE